MINWLAAWLYRERKTPSISKLFQAKTLYSPFARTGRSTNTHMTNHLPSKLSGTHTLHRPLPSSLSLVSFSSLPLTHAHTRPSLSGREEGSHRDGRRKKLPRSHQKHQQLEVCLPVDRRLGPLVSGVAAGCVVLKRPFPLNH